MANEELARKVDEAWRANYAALEGTSKPRNPSGVLALESVDFGSFCETWPKIYKTAMGLLDTFAWLIPDKIENLVRAGLKTVNDVLIPMVCPK